MESLHNGGKIKIKYKISTARETVISGLLRVRHQVLDRTIPLHNLAKTKWDTQMKLSDQVCQFIRNTRENRPGTEENLFWKKNIQEYLTQCFQVKVS